MTVDIDTAPTRDLDAAPRSAGLVPGDGGAGPAAAADGARATWAAAAAVAVAVACLVVFVLSVQGLDLAGMSGLGLVSVLPVGAVAAVTVVALAFVAALHLRVPPVGLAALLVVLVVCLDGVTAFAEPEPRFPSAYQIAGFVQYIGSTGHSPAGLTAYFSWPGFFALVSLVTGAAGLHSVLWLMRIWPVVVDLASLAPLFLLMRGLRMSSRARWLAAFFFTVGNWVGQDYFSPQSLNLVFYLVFLAILVNWFTDPTRPPWARAQRWRPVRWHRRVVGPLRPGERHPRPATAGERSFLYLLLVGIFVASTVSHQLTPFFLLAAAAALVVIRRSTVPGLPVLLGVIFAGYISFAAIGYWSGHLSTAFAGVGDPFSNLSTSVNGRLSGSSATHLLVLHARELVFAVVIGLALAGMVRRRLRGRDDRILIAFLLIPVALVGVFSYGGEIALRTYLFMLPAAAIFAAWAFFPEASSARHPAPARSGWRTVGVLAVCALVLPAGFLLVRYGNDAFEQVPPGELAASDWIYAHEPHGGKVLWLSTDPAIDVTPQMPWAYRDVATVGYVPTLAPRHPGAVGGLVAALSRAGPGSYLVVDRTQIAAMEETAGYPSDWGSRFAAAMAAAHGVRLAYSTGSADVYTLHWPPGARPRPPAPAPPGTASGWGWTRLGLVALGALVGLLLAAELIRLRRPGARAPRVLWLVASPLFVVVAADVLLRFAVLSG